MTDFEELVLLLSCKATLILGIVAALSLLVGRRWPQSCTTWLRFGVVALWALPLAVWALPTIGIPILSPSPPAKTSLQTASAESAVRQPGSAIRNDNSPATTSSLPAAGSEAPRRHGWSPVKTLGLCLAAAYGLVALVLAIRFIGAWRGLERLRRDSSPVLDPTWQATLTHWSKMLQIRRRVELRASDIVSVPMTFGWRVPVILVPNDCMTPCEKTQREAIIVHELTHIARSDFFWQALTQLTAIMYWMHPLVWLIRRQDGALRERLCDAFCSQHLSREAYAQALVRIAGRKYFRPAAALGMAMAHPASLRRRLNDLQADAPVCSSLPSRRQRAFQGGTAALVLGLIVAGTLTTRVSGGGSNGDESAASDKNAPVAQQAAAKKKEVRPVRLPDTIQGEIVDLDRKPVANASVTVLIRRFNPYVDPADAAAPKPWTTTTDERGRYTISTSNTMLGPDDEVRIKVRAEGFADSSQVDYERRLTKGKLPVQQLHAGRKVHGRLVDPAGKPIGPAIIRFHVETEDFSMMWDSGPLSVDQPGAFSASIPKAGVARFVIYPRGYAPQIVEVPENGADLGAIRVESGTSLTGRVVDRTGQGVAGTVVAILSDKAVGRIVRLPIGTAVKTDETGRFTLPPVRGTYTVRVTGSAPDYTRQLMETGAKPPPMLPERIDFDGVDKTQEIEFREAVSVTVRGKVRWADGSGAPDVVVESSMLPLSWQSGVALDNARTDAEGRYTLRVPASVERLFVTVSPSFRAPDGTYPAARAVGKGANPIDQNRNIVFEMLTEDVEDADWELSPPN